MCVTTTNKLFVIKIPLGSSESLSVARLPLFFFLVFARCNLKYSFYVSGEFNWFLLWTLRKMYRFPFFTARILRIFRCSLALRFLWDTIIVISSKGARTFIIASCLQPTIRKTKLNNKKCLQNLLLSFNVTGFVWLVLFSLWICSFRWALFNRLAGEAATACCITVEKKGLNSIT